MRSLILLVALLAQPVAAQERERLGMPRLQVGNVSIGRRLTPVEAQVLALADLSRLTPEQQLLTRYIWIREPSADSVRSLSRTLNFIGRGLTMRPVPLAGNKLLRVNLATLTKDVDAELTEIVDWWEEFRFDYNFVQLLTPDMLTVIKKLPKNQWPLAVVRNDKGKFERVELDTLAKADVVRIPTGPQDLIDKLQLATLSAAPVVSKEYFELRATTQFQGADGASGLVYRKVWGGLYYRGAGIKKSSDPNLSDFKFLLKTLGASAEDAAEQRIAVKRSAVAGKQARAIEARPTQVLRVSDGQSVIVATFDVRKDSIDASQSALRTLDGLAYKFDGSEVFFTKPNGLIAAALFNGKGQLVDAVPQEIASDRTVPEPNHTILEPIASCDRCHNSRGNSGWIPADNYVQKLLKKGYDVFGDGSRAQERIDKTLQRLDRQYRGNLTGFFQVARFSLQKATLAATGPWDGPPVTIVTQAAKKLEADSVSYWYSDVTPRQALLELGIDVDEKIATEVLASLLRPDPDSLVYGFNFIPEDVMIASLRVGEGISRQEWAFVYQFAAARARKTIAALAIGAKKP